jgi:hypothetical protein
MSASPTPRKTLRTLTREALEARTPPLPPEAVAVRTAALLVAMARIDQETQATSPPDREVAATRDLVLAGLPLARQAGWRAALLAVMDVTIGVLARSSRILPVLSSPFATQAIAWRLAPVPPGLTRSAAGTMRAATADGRMTALLDDVGAERRIIVMIHVADDQAPPIMLLVGATGTPDAIEIDPEIIIEAGCRRLRYEALVEPGAYHVAFGNPREEGDVRA